MAEPRPPAAARGVPAREPQRLIPVLPPRVTGRSSISVFLTSIWAFLRRELKNQFGKFHLGYFWAFADPAAAVAVFTLLHAVLRGSHAKLYGVSPIVFFVFSAVSYFLFSHCMTRAQGVCDSHRGLFNYRQIKPIDIILARTLTEAVLMLVVAAVFVLGWGWFGQPMRIQDPLLMIAGLLSLYVMGVALGLIFEVYGTVFPDMRRIFGMVMRPMIFISGLFFTMEMVPHVYRPFLYWNPVLHAVDLVRDGVIHGYTSPGSLLYVCCWALVLLFFGLSAYRRYLYRLI